MNVPWYFDEVGSHVLDNRTECCLRGKACGEFHFIQLSDRSGKLIGTPFFHRFRSDTEDSASKVSSGKDPKDLRGPGDLLLFLSVTLSKAINPKQASELLLWFDLELKIHPARGGEIEVKPNLVWPTSGANLETFADPDKYFIKYSPSDKDKILVASLNVREAVARIAEVWHNPSVTSVLLCAWTGSGKEPLKDLFMHGMQQSDPSLPPFSAPSLVSQEGRSAPEQIAEALVKRKLTRDPTRTWNCGKFRFERIPGKLKRHTVVFVDEIHHPSAQSVREALLVLMETSKFEHNGKLYDCKGQLTFLFAASEAPEELRRRDPVDFWTHIEHTIPMSHPLKLKREADRTLALQQYFGLFWKMALKESDTTALYPLAPELYLLGWRGLR